MGILEEFMDFLKEYNAIALAVAFIMGGATKDFVSSLVNNLVMPFLAPVLPGQAWQTATVSFGPVELGAGAFLASAINFLVLAAVVFVVFKKLPEKGRR